MKYTQYIDTGLSLQAWGVGGGNPVVTYTATQQNYTATSDDYQSKCGSVAVNGYVGPTRTNNTATSTTSQAAANAKALALATQAAKDAINCEVNPPSYEWTLTGPSDTDSTGVTLTTDGGVYLLKYNRIFNGDSNAKRMDITAPGGQQVAVDFPASYLGFGFTLTIASTIYSGTYTDGTPTLTAS